MKRRLMLFISVASTFSCLGCGANFNAAYREFDINKGESVSVDAKQRVVLVSNDPRKGSIVCAEPSPDALSSVAASLTASGSYSEKVAIQLAAATAESTTNIGLRTQTIQLLRDAMYRLCEGYLGGALSDADFSRLQRRYQNAMLGLLAIEQLTGAVTPKQVVLNSQAGADAGRKILKAQRALQAAQTASDSAAKELKDAQKALQEQKDQLASLTQKAEQAKADAASDASKQAAADKAAADVTKQKSAVTDAQKIVDAKKAAADAADKEEENAQEALDAAKALTAQASADGTIDGGAVRVSANGDVTAVSSTVKQIVEDIVSADYTEETCVNSLVGNKPTAAMPVSTTSNRPEYNAGVEFCLKVLEAGTQRQALMKQQYSNQLKMLQAQ